MKINALKLITIFLLSMLLFTFCKKDSPTESGEEGNNDVLMPLAEGNTWVYTPWSIIDGDTSIGTLNIHPLSISGKITFLGKEYWRIDRADTSDIGTRRNTDEGLFIGTIYGDTLIVETLYKYPVANNEVYSSNDRSITVQRKTITLFSGEQYNCYKYWSEYSILGESFTIEDYFVPGIGLIRWMFLSGDYSSGDDLTDYTLY